MAAPDRFSAPATSLQTRRILLKSALAATTALALGRGSSAASRAPFEQWVATFRARALARGISDETYTRVMSGIKPDTSVYALDRAQPEFQEELWQYLNQRVSEWRVMTGKARAKEFAPLLERIERDYGVAPSVMLGLWGMESAFGDPGVYLTHMRPIIPALAALAWGEPRRRKYWEAELLNALVIIERGWAKPEDMKGSWAGAMGHTQWMPAVWLNVGVDYDGDGRITPFGKPDDALAGTARYLVERGDYRRGEHWGYEVRAARGGSGAKRTYAAWQAAGIVRADGKPFPQPGVSAKLWVPVKGGPGFLLAQNFYAIRKYNPSMNYALAIAHLGDRVMGGGALVQIFPGGERTMTLAELQELQQRLTAAGFDTAGVDGRVGNQTKRAVRAFQQKVGLEPADGYPGLKVLARLRQGS